MKDIVNRRIFLKRVVAGGIVLTNLQIKDSEIMTLRPHHLLDIITDFGLNKEFKPHPYGHANHIVAKKVLSDQDLKTKFIVGADDICKPCKHLLPDGSCDDVLQQLTPPISKQKYNDSLDRRLLTYLGFNAGAIMTVREYLTLVNKKVPGIEQICTHPKEDQKLRLEGLTQGLKKLGIRS